MTKKISDLAGAIKADTPLFAEMFDVMDRLEYRRAVTEEDFEDIGRLRQKAYDSRDIYERKFGKYVIEDLDRDPRTYVFGVYFQDQLVSTLRINHVTPENRMSPAVAFFGNVLNPLLDQGLTFIDPSRLAIDPSFAKMFPGLPIMTQRLPVIATIQLQASYGLFAVLAKHRAYYLRVFRATLLAGPILSPGMNIDVILLACALQNRKDLFERFPVFNFKDAEGRLLFGNDKRENSPLCVRPTARLALNAA